MITVTFVFLTLLAWLTSSDTWLSRCGLHEETTALSASCKNAVIHIRDKTNLTCERYSEMSTAFEKISTQKWITKDCAVIPLNCIILNGCMNLFKSASVNAEKEKRHVCICTVLPFLVFFRSKTSCLLLTVEIKCDNQCVLLRSVVHCTNIITLFLVYDRKTTGCSCICEVCDLRVKILHGFVHRKLRCGFSECLIFILCDIQMSSEGTLGAYIRIYCVKMPFNATQCAKETFLTPADGRGRVKSVQPTDSSRWTGRVFLLAVLLLVVHRAGLKISSNRVSPAHDSNSTMVRLFAVTLSCFSPSVSIYQLCEWSIIAVSLCCALGRTVHVLIACKAAHTVMKQFCPTQQHFRSLPVTVLCLWLTFVASFSNKNMNHRSTDVYPEDNVGSTLRSWAVLGHVALLVTLYCVFVSLPSLLQAILSKLNFLSFIFHLQLVMCRQNSRIPAKYVLVIKISGFI